jgi:hypothetical protein
MSRETSAAWWDCLAADADRQYRRALPRVRMRLDLPQLRFRSNSLMVILRWSVPWPACEWQKQRGVPAARALEQAMSVILRILFVIAGLITALFVAQDALNFGLIQTWVAILLVTVLVGIGSLWAWRQRA